jgi:hypothetical protein
MIVTTGCLPTIDFTGPYMPSLRLRKYEFTDATPSFNEKESCHENESH